MSVSGNLDQNAGFDEDLDLLDALLADDLLEQQPAIAARAANQGPLSFQQERLWFLSELDPDAAAYTIFNAFRLHGQLNEQALCAALETLVERHEALRTAIDSQSGKAEQRIMPGYMPVQKSIDLTDSTEESADEALHKLLLREAARPFVLADGKPFRAVLAKLGPDEHALMLSLHHIISDAWSMTVLMSELAVLYHAYARGERPLLPHQPVRYLDYALWQRESGVARERENKEMNYWLAELQGLPLLELPCDLPRPQKQTFNGATISFQLPAATTRALQTLAHSERSTLFSLMMAALHVLMGRHARQADIAIGTSIAGRDNPELEGLVGFFANMVVIRARLESDPSFRELLRTTTGKVHAAMDHGTLAYDRLVEGMKIARDPSRNPLFQVAMTMLNLPATRMSLGTLEAERLLSQEAARFDLELFLSESEGTLSGTFVYNTDLFLPASVNRLTEQWLILLADIAVSPDKPVSRLALVKEQAPLLSLPLQAEPLPFRPLHELILQHAEKYPERRALRLGEESLSYGELAAQARRIAHVLLNAGIKAEVPVGLWFEPGFDMIAAMLGTWLAGGGYLPVDIHSPAERIATILEDSQVKFILSDTASAVTLPAFAGTLLCIDETDEPPAGELPQVSADQLAYIIYTSGSTGRPKGVEITHANVARLFTACDSLFEFDRNDVWTFFHSYAFDFSVWEIWGALVHGASLLIVPPIVARTTDSFYDLLCDKKVTVLSQTPSAFRQLMAAEEANPREGDLALRYVVFGGEALDIASLASWMDRHGDEEPRLVNMYGITEITVHATFRLINWRDLARASSSVIGAPLPDLCLRLLDPHGEPVPQGMVGEIFVGGAGVARGYRHQPELTAARFQRDASGMPFYRSGDLARINAWGEMEYRGRADSQIKLRGYRIETGEIENTLRRHPAIDDAVVVVRGQQETARLVAYVRKRQTCLPESGASAEDWRPSFDMIYAAEVEDDELDVVGWNDSYDNKPLPLEEMRLWRDEILQRLRALAPTRILEMGTGSGMLLLPLAQQVERYQGLDFSAEAVARLSRKVAQRGLTHVQLEQREARDLAGLAEDFDLVILNSVAQYFPDARYFIDVMEQAMDRLQTDGRLFVGDLRHLGLLRHFHASRLAHRRPAGADRASLLAQLAKMVEEEKELLVDPDFFFHWAAQRNDIARIDVLPKVSGGANELTTYRYDVVLVKGEPQTSAPAARMEAASVEAAWRGEPALICNIPNSRLAAVEAFLGWLAGDAAAAPGAQEWDAWSDTQSGSDPAALVDIWQARAGAAKLCWASQGQPGQFDLAVAASNAALPAFTPAVSRDTELTRFFNVPVQLREGDALATTLRSYLSAYLPDYMLPAVYVPLDVFPLTINGKLDFAALPEAGQEIKEAAAEQDQQLSETERKVADVWAEVLQLARPALHANFFETGGHSLLATQVISRLNAAFAVKLPLRSLFDRPTIAGLAALLDDLQKKTASALPQPAAIRPVPREGLLPLAYTQQRFWFMEQIDQGPVGSHNISLALRLRGQLAPAALRTAIQAIVTRHEALRTLFIQHDGEPAQLIRAEWTPAIEEADFSHLPRDEAETALRTLLSVQANTRFSLDVAPPLRLNLVRMGEQEHVLQLTLHHAICDGWSLGVMVREFSECYSACLAGRSPQLATLPVQLADFAVWQRSEMAGARLQSILQQWKQRLQGVPYGLALPFERAPHADTPQMGKIIYFNFDALQLGQLKRFAETNGATLFMALAAGYAALLGRYSGVDDVVIGTPIAQRQQKELEGIVGCFLNTLALRIQGEGGLSGQALLAHVRERVLEAYEWQDAPFDAVVSELSPERSRDSHALFQTMLTLQNMPLGNFTLPGLEVEPLQGQEGVAGFDLSLTFIETADASGQAGLQGMLEYDANKFLYASVEHFATQLKTLLLAMAAKPEMPVNRLDLLAADERQWLLETLNATRQQIPQLCLHELIAQQASRTPDSIAIRDAAGEISYAELEARANALACALHDRGVGPDTIVGLCTERDRGMVIGLLGIMKAGAAYLPLDPAYPTERLDLILADARPPVLVTQTALTSTTSFSGPKILLEELGQASRCPASGATLANLAYIIYTSGSTGVPKGVMITHGAIVNYLSWALDNYMPGSEGSVLMTPSYAFDGSMTTLFTPLLSGRCMQLMLRDDVLSRIRNSLLESKEPLALIDCGPAQLEVLQHVLQPEQLAASQVDAIVIGGEALHAATVEQWRRHAPATRLYNEYGPTEATVGCCNYHITADTPWFGAVPIGRGIWNVRIYVLDDYLQPLPVGMPGDLYVAGEGLARGYAGKPALTAQSFIPDPFSAGGRLYRTGDRACWGTGGVIHYLGRSDNQVKFRGFRIEPGEIEEKIRLYPGVSEAAVKVHTDGQGVSRLVAWLAAENHDGLDAWLRESLPGFMVPSHYVLLPTLPISVSGKVDRNALPSPAIIHQPQASGESRALNATEQRLAAIWQEVVGHPVSDPQANFFEAGGDSLRAVKLIFLIEREFKRVLPLASLFGLHTLEAQAAALTSDSNAATDALVPIHVRENAPSVVLVHDISGQILSYRSLAEELTTFGVYAIQALAEQHTRAPSVTEMAELYARAIVEARLPGPLILVGHSFGAQVATELSRKLTTLGKTPLLLAILDGIAEPDRESLQQLPRDDLDLMDYMIRTIELSMDKRIDVDAARLRALPEGERESWITASITEAGVVPEHTSPEHVMQLFTIYKNNLESLHGYQPGRVACPVTLWATDALAQQGDAGWEKYADRVTVYQASGDHVGMLKPPHVQELAASLTKAINDEMR
ncbi:amino acid adenylation domain-containing protein [Erwinia sp. BNK-24-b]|uniref:amino acid adenylation domain-containing protein n=1 Tax=unclassified Erwinia TaxID=2622719 RepID=UPI0039BED2A3